MGFFIEKVLSRTADFRFSNKGHITYLVLFHICPYKIFLPYRIATFWILLDTGLKVIEKVLTYSFGRGMILSYLKEGALMTVKQYRVYLGWSISELARRAGTTTKTIRRIEAGLPVNDYIVGPVARAFSEALGKNITVYDLEGVTLIET